jgi:hypothetical protein
MRVITISILLSCVLSCANMNKQAKQTSFDETILCYNRCREHAPIVLEELGFTKKEMETLDVRDICREFCMTITQIKMYLRGSQYERNHKRVP